ncbi:alpha/beta hydrolase [Aquabacterium sp.]|uniref:alpha/beta hydrolase n=1 Tax=Aquabacterium sp. TaxID=1872578 RepID=UPI0035AE68A2
MSAVTVPNTDEQLHAGALAEPVIRHFLPPTGAGEAIGAAVLRTTLRALLKPVLRLGVPLSIQRGVLHALSVTMLQAGGVEVRKEQLGPIMVERIRPKGIKPRQAVLYLHGGAFCTGSPRSHRSLTTRFARYGQAEVLVPDYRRIPEHAFPTQIEDCLMAYKSLLKAGWKPEQIAIAGDSAGGTLTLQVCLAARLQGLPMPACMVMMSPAIDMSLSSRSATERAAVDPLINVSWGRQAISWLKVPAGHPLAHPSESDLAGLPPMLVQVGEDEVLFDDAHWIAHGAAKMGGHAELEIYLKRWHVFPIHAGALPSATAALGRQIDFMRRHWRV